MKQQYGDVFLTETIKLKPRLDLSAAEALVSDMTKQELSSGITLDASEVNHLGALCAQAIIAGARAVQDAGGQMQIVNASERVEEQLGVMGLSIATLEGGAR